MEQLNQVNIEEQSTIYDVSLRYHMEANHENYCAKIVGVEEADGTITLKPLDGESYDRFEFNHSDPDTVIAISQMILAFAQMAKNNKKSIDDRANV